MFSICRKKYTSHIFKTLINKSICSQPPGPIKIMAFLIGIGCGAEGSGEWKELRKGKVRRVSAYSGLVTKPLKAVTGVDGLRG